MRKGSVAIVGCGWLGLPLAEHLVGAGYEVHGSTTSPDKLAAIRATGATAHLVDLPLAGPLDEAAAAKTERVPPPGTDAFASAASRTDEPDPTEPLWACEQLVLAVPPGRAPDAPRTYPAAILSAVLRYRRSQPAGRIAFTSSTGVYEGATGEVDESTPITGRSAKVRKLALAESQVAAQSQRPYVILRLGGLYGGDRHPGRTLAGRADLPQGDAPVNLVSRERVIAEITALLDHPFWRQPIRNVVDEAHPPKADFYRAYAEDHDLPVPTFLPGGADGKVIVSRVPTLASPSAPHSAPPARARSTAAPSRRRRRS